MRLATVVGALNLFISRLGWLMYATSEDDGSRVGTSTSTVMASLQSGGDLASARSDDWGDWVSATATRAYCKNDPLLYWLNLYGEEHGFERDDAIPGYDQRTDFLPFILRQGRLFEQAVLRYLDEAVAPITVICTDRADIQSEEKLAATMDAMSSAAPLIGQSVLWNPVRRTYGAADLLVRSDVLRRLFPDLISEDDAHIGAMKLGIPYHYRVVDVKFSTLGLLKDGHVGGPQAHYMVQVWIYNDALAHMQGYEPPAAYLLGRGWSASGDLRGRNCMERLGRVNHDYVLRNGLVLEDLANEAVDWVRRGSNGGASVAGVTRANGRAVVSQHGPQRGPAVA